MSPYAVRSERPHAAGSFASAPFYSLRWSARCCGDVARRIERGSSCWILGYAGLTRCETPHATYYLAPGDAVMLVPSATERVVCKAKGEVWWLEFGGALATGHLDFLRRSFSPFHERITTASNAVVRTAERLLRALKNPKRGEHGLLDQSLLVFEWLAVWQTFLENHRPRIRDLYTLSPTNPRLEQFAPYTLKELGRWLGQSQNTVRRHLADRWKLSPAKVLREVRLRAAARTLQTTTLPVAAVATRWGFASPGAFAQALRRHFGLLPQQCRALRTSLGGPRPRSGKATRRPVERVRRSDAGAPKQARSADWEGPYFQVFLCADSVRQEPREQELWHGIVHHVAFVYTVEGCGDFSVDGVVSHAIPGSIILHPLPVAAKWLNPPQDPPWRRIFVMLRGALASAYFEYLVNRFGWRLPLPPENSVLARLLAIRRKVALGSFRPAIEWSRLGYQFLHALHAAFLAQPSKTTERPPWIALPEARAAHPPRSVAELAKAAGYTRTAYYRKMKSIWPRPPGYVLRARRIELAAKALRTTVVSVQKIAAQAGYRSPAAFSAAFKSIYGTCPLEYRRQHRI